MQKNYNFKKVFPIGLFIILFIINNGCHESEQRVLMISDQTIKQKTISNFKSAIKSFCDSSMHYFDIAFEEIEKGNNLSEITNEVKPKILFFEDKINERSKEFAQEAKNTGIDSTEFEKAYEDLNTYVQKLGDNYKKLEKKGIIINEK